MAMSSKPTPDRGDARQPQLLIPVGRGRQGKTLFIRWAVERAQRANRSVILGDADRTNQTLSEYFSGVTSPSADTEPHIVKWFQAFTSIQAEQRLTACIDVGGGDTIIRLLARDGIADLMSKVGIELVIAYFVGADEDDLRYMELLEKSWRRARPKSFIVFNKNGLPSDMDEIEVVDKVLMPNAALKSALGHGSQIIRMPKLQASAEIERHRLPFWQAIDQTSATGFPKLNIWNTHHVETWLEEMDKATTPISELLP